MTPEKFPESNRVFGPPPSLEEPQCMSIPAYVHEIEGGSCDGSPQVVVAWRLTADELQVLNEGGLLYISMIGGLAPHYPSVDFYSATHPA